MLVFSPLYVDRLDQAQTPAQAKPSSLRGQLTSTRLHPERQETSGEAMEKFMAA